ncbi:secreted Zn-dependent insulinase-like peptidase [Litorivivens lipolytica]|uniref:Secreted Zn-dependent insulinase-like peptidase n=1 Tax=Litorivivens lipolytica TaxID=1524264 RepID=A0A7W4Z717_9GAMM|nr:insulinase family protein [Litorivivens lipolytica]MBB3047555.1 secreted Zn-dependent insulinase-like peptidase [Litorivivens lipolytica]
MISADRLRTVALACSLGLAPFSFAADIDRHIREHDNGLRSLNLSRPDRANALIGIQINAGSFQDALPSRNTIPGLAHLAEHVFLRQTIRDEGREILELRDYLALNGGRVTAKTGHNTTYFIFEIQHRAAPHLLRALARLIRQPQFSTAIIASEISAVDDEFGFLKTKAHWLLQDALKAATVDGHPFRHNGAGNRESFSPYSLDYLQSALQAFFSRYYRAANLSLIYVSPENRTTQNKHIALSFGSLPSLPASNTAEPEIFSPDTLPRRLRVQAPVSSPQFTLLLPLQGASRKTGENLIDYLRYWTQATGAGSWQQQLADTGLFRQVALSRGIATGDQATLSLHWVPSAQGLNSPELTRDTLLQALYTLAKQARNPAIADHFKVRRQEQGAQSPNYIESDHVYQWLQKISQADGTASVALPDDRFFSLLEKRRWLLIELLPTLDSSHRSPLFSVPWQLLPLPDLSTTNPLPLSAFTPPVKLKETRTLPQLSSSVSRPEKIFSEGSLEIWHAASTHPNEQIMLHLSLDIPEFNLSQNDRALAELWLSALKITTRDFPGRRWTRHPNGMRVELRGSIATLQQQLASISEDLQTALTEAEFESLKTRLIDDWRQTPDYRFAFEALVDQLRVALQPEHDSRTDRIAALDTSVHSDWLTLQQQSLAGLRATLFVYGADRDSAHRLSQSLELPLAATAIEQERPGSPSESLIPSQGLQRTELFSDANALLRYHPAVRQSASDEARYQLLLPLLKRQYFARLREQQQLAYGVTVVPVELDQHQGLALIAQSATSSPDTLHQATEQFLKDFPQWLNTLPEAQLVQVKSQLLTELDSAALRGEKLAEHYWSEITRQRIAVEYSGSGWNDKVQRAVNALQAEDLSQYFQSIFLNREQEGLILEGWPRRGNQPEVYSSEAKKR